MNFICNIIGRQKKKRAIIRPALRPPFFKRIRIELFGLDSFSVEAIEFYLAGEFYL